MSTLSDETARADVAASTERLAAITGQRPRYFAYPYGDVSRAVASIVRDSGYAAAFSIDRPGRYRYAFERTQVTPLNGRALFAIKASGRYLSWRNSAAIRASYGAVKPLLRPVLDRRR
jgi:peptidoglycan/xylan/chitin deacetylase (PgdA/CDA1 family)